MVKKRPLIALLLIVVIFALIAFVSLSSDSSITGLAVYENLRSIGSQNILAAVGPIAVFIILFSVAITALHKLSKE